MPRCAEPLLIPRPRRVRIHDGAVRLGGVLSYEGMLADVAFRLLTRAAAMHGIRFVPGLASGERGECSVIRGEVDAVEFERDGWCAYVLRIGPGGIELRGADEAGLRCGLATLAQLIGQSGRELPALEISDEARIRTRGLMLDVSRCRVPTMSQLFAIVDDLERLKMNHLQLYMEHTFVHAGHEEVWKDASPLTPDEVRDLDTYCASRGVELSANQNTLGHMERWLAHDRYLELAEIPDRDQAWTFHTPSGRTATKRGPFSLCPTDPRSIDLVRDLLDQLLPCFGSQQVNIGCDEAFDVGQGRSKAEVESRGYGAVYGAHLSAVNDVVHSHGKRSLFWGDMLARHGRAQVEIPPEMRPLVWGYERESVFESNVAGLEPAWSCPGTSSWLSIVGRATTRRENIRAAADAHGIDGLMVCDWGDQGHRQHWPIALLAIANAASDAWGRSAEQAFDARAASLHVFGDESLNVGPWIEALGDVDAGLSGRLSLRNAGALYTEMHRHLCEPERPGTLDEWSSIRNQLGDVRDGLSGFAKGLAPLVRAELEHTLWQAEHAAEKAILCRSEPGGVPRGPARIRLAAEMGSILEEFRELWHSRARSGGLDESSVWYERIIDDYEHPE